MTRLKSLLVAGICLGLMQGTALAQDKEEDNSKPTYTTAQMFAERCKTASGPDSWCRGFIIGFDQAHTTFSYMDYRKQGSKDKFAIEKYGLLYCPGPDVSFEKAIDIIVRYIHRNPSKNDDPAGIAVARALSESFPCK